jgi:ribonuclease HII
MQLGLSRRPAWLSRVPWQIWKYLTRARAGRLPDPAGGELPQTPLVKGDARSLSIAAAAILAKTARDAVLVELDQSFPGYSFAKNKGYGTVAHRQAIAAGTLQPAPEHFAPVSAYDSFFPPQTETVKLGSPATTQNGSNF